MTYEGQFLDALKSIFIGAKVEGDSGYINLMKIKANYFEKGVFPVLMKDIDSACKPFEKGFREELFDKLYDFFQHYFSESGSIYFRNTAQHHNIYEKVYTDDRDVMLFWKTHMLYYVKTDRLFNSMEIEVDGEKFFFDVSGMELKRSNEKRELTYTFKSIKNGVITLTVGYSEKGRKTKIDEIVKAVKDKGMTLDEETLEKAFRVFEKQSEVDYFINKNAKAFLQEQFDLWMYQYIFKGESEFNETRLKQLQAIKAIAYKIIDFIAQFEDELVKVWNKPKFVLNSAYIITLDHVIARSGATKQSPDGKGEIASGKNTPRNDIVQKIFKHKGMKDQIAEWIELGMVDKKFKLDLILEKNLLGEPANPQYQYLPLDTKYFKDLELDILALFDDLDSALDGWLIHSENYQALNTLLPKFRERVKAIYIDPPYNTGTDGFAYKDSFQHSTWLTMMSDRIRLSTGLLSNDSVVFTSIDDNESHNLMTLQHSIFGAESFLGVITWEKRTKAQNTETAKRMLQSKIEYIQAFRTSTKQQKFNLEENSKKEYPLKDKQGSYRLQEVGQMASDGIRGRETMVYPIRGIKPRKSMQWKLGEAEVTRLDSLGRLVMNGDKPMVIFRPGDEDDSSYIPFWSHFFDKDTYGTAESGLDEIRSDLGFGRAIETVKPTKLLSKLIFHVVNDSELVFDYFAGSGTTANAVINLNRNGGKRRYVCVEMGEYFETIIIPRIKKVVFSDNWKDGKAQEGKGVSHFAKYFELEQYEDALKKARYEDAPLFAGTQDAYTSYVFLRDLKMLEAVKVDKKKNKVEVNLEKLYDGIDLAETLSCLTGKWIRRITKDTVEFQDGTSASLSAPEWDDVKPLIWW